MNQSLESSSPNTHVQSESVETYQPIIYLLLKKLRTATALNLDNLFPPPAKDLGLPLIVYYGINFEKLHELHPEWTVVEGHRMATVKLQALVDEHVKLPMYYSAPTRANLPETTGPDHWIGAWVPKKAAPKNPTRAELISLWQLAKWKFQRLMRLAKELKLKARLALSNHPNRNGEIIRTESMWLAYQKGLEQYFNHVSGHQFDSAAEIDAFLSQPTGEYG